MENKNDKKIKTSLGILAHVDAGKTTLAEAILYLTNVIGNIGRVDHGNTFLDTDELEKKRGITIFSKQARFSLPDLSVTLIDTPGHVDFAPEAERTLSVLDHAILVISGTDGVQSHTKTLWSLLRRYGIPVFVFVNKTDISKRSEEEMIKNLSSELGSGFVNFTHPKDEDIASEDEILMEHFLSVGELPKMMISDAFEAGKIFPVYFGSALRLTGVEEMLLSINSLIAENARNVASKRRTEGFETFSCRVFKITRDSYGTRLTHAKIESGNIKIKSEINKEKINQIRLYSGDRYETTDYCEAGDIVAFSGLETTFAGQIIGEGISGIAPFLSPVMSYRLILQPGTDVAYTFKLLKILEEELPEISLVHLEDTNEIQVRIMGEIQIEVLKSLMKERFSIDAEFGVGTIIYKETVSGISEGVGHFEPLRHYAEVHLKIEPAPRGSGICCTSDLSEDILEKNWQRLILTHLAEKNHKGILTGAVLTDVKITLVGGRAHEKHTEGGDFRQATYRAVRHGLMYNSPVLLEPWYDFMIEVPSERLGRIMTDIPQMFGLIRTHEINGSTAIVYGRCPVSTMHGYSLTLNALTKGEGKLTVSSGGYDICHNSEEVIQAAAYDPGSDIRNTADSVFCAHGAGFVVPWDEVTKYMHIEPCLKKVQSEKWGSERSATQFSSTGVRLKDSYDYSASAALDSELEEIFRRTYGDHKEGENRLLNRASTTRSRSLPDHIEVKETSAEDNYLLVDGYNIIFSWPELKELAKTDLNAARLKLADILCNYRGYKNCELILVFDAYKVEGGVEKTEKYHNIHIVYTKEAETADRYIERTTKKLVRRSRVTVATSDATEQVIIFGSGASRLSAGDLLTDVETVNSILRTMINSKSAPKKGALADLLDEESKKLLDSHRLP